MNWKMLAVMIGLAIALGVGSKAHAQNDQTFVIGFGLGIHSFSTTDDVRGNLILPIDTAGMSELLFEWYLLGELGIGVRLINLGVTETVTTFGGTTETEITVNNALFTLNWVPFGGSSYTRFGLLAGIGPSEYEVTQTVNSGTSSSNSASGTASLAGLYLDWGGDTFGARFGAHFLSTDLEKLNGAKVDGSGTSVYFDLRWAF